MNCQGNVLGPGNRANSSIGRAIRLIQMNVLGSVPGAGCEPAHGRPVLDPSMMGQPAKYAGYHIVENEELFPSLIPHHVELGFDASDSTVTVFLVAGSMWIEAQGEGSPEEWVENFAQTLVGSGRLMSSGCSCLLLPPENAQLFVNAGWTKAEIRTSFYESTRRSVAWLKASRWQTTTVQRKRPEQIEPGDEDIFMAAFGSADARDLPIAVCGGPAGGLPFFLDPVIPEHVPVTRKVTLA